MVQIRRVARKDKDFDEVGWKGKILKAKKPKNGSKIPYHPNLVGMY